MHTVAQYPSVLCHNVSTPGAPRSALTRHRQKKKKVTGAGWRATDLPFPWQKQINKCSLHKYFRRQLTYLWRGSEQTSCDWLNQNPKQTGSSVGGRSSYQSDEKECCRYTKMVDWANVEPREFNEKGMQRRKKRQRNRQNEDVPLFQHCGSESKVKRSLCVFEVYHFQRQIVAPWQKKADTTLRSVLKLEPHLRTTATKKKKRKKMHNKMIKRAP